MNQDVFPEMIRKQTHWWVSKPTLKSKWILFYYMYKRVLETGKHVLINRLGATSPRKEIGLPGEQRKSLTPEAQFPF